MTRTALYPGSFDPPTNGHLAVIRAALRICDRLVVAIGVHATKSPLLSADERAALIQTVTASLAVVEGGEIIVTRFSGLAIEAARDVGAGCIVRGLRSGVDFEDEIVMAGMNRAMAPEIETLFVPASIETRHITGTLVRQIAAMGGDVSSFVPSCVLPALRAACRLRQVSAKP